MIKDYQNSYWEQKKRRHPSDRIISDFVRPKLDFIWRYIQAPDFILDVGCGNGYFTYYLAQIATTIGLDNSEAMLRQNPVKTLVRGSADHLPFPDAAFDLVMCSNLLHHTSNPLHVIIEMKRTSKRYVVLSEPNRYNPAMLALSIAKREERRTLKFTFPYVRRLVHQAHLTIIDGHVMGFVTPNRMPRKVASWFSRFNQPNPFAAYIVLIAERPNSSRSDLR